MTHTTEQARQQLLDSLGDTVEAIDAALASLGEAHEQLDDQMAQRLEQDLFRPVQRAYAPIRHLYASYAEAGSLQTREFEPQGRRSPSHGAKGFIQDAVEAVSSADETLASLQDSMLPIEVGDEQLRATLAGVRQMLSAVPGKAEKLIASLGR